MADCERKTSGDRVAFIVEASRDGRPLATRIELLDEPQGAKRLHNWSSAWTPGRPRALALDTSS